MDIVKSFSRRSLGIMLLVMAVFTVSVGLAFYFNVQSSINGMLALTRIDTSAPEIRQTVEQLALKQNELTQLLIGGLAVALVVVTVLMWFVLKISFGRLMKQAGITKTAGVATEPAPGATGRKEKKHYDRRMFLHLLSVLQREGRLLDFFAEDLSLYEDEQIGAAVRTIHEDCKTTMNKYLALKPVIDEPEGEEVTIESDFDPNAVKLTGNVTGEPPFMGVVRHKGWKATRTELPELSETRDSSIVSPAEVEVE